MCWLKHLWWIYFSNYNNDQYSILKLPTCHQPYLCKLLKQLNLRAHQTFILHFLISIFTLKKKILFIAVPLNFSVGFSPKFSRTYISARWDTFHTCAHCVVLRVILLPLFFQTITTSSLLPFYCFFGPISLELYAKIEIHFYFDKFYHFGIVETRHSLALSLDWTF